MAHFFWQANPSLQSGFHFIDGNNLFLWSAPAIRTARESDCSTSKFMDTTQIARGKGNGAQRVSSSTLLRYDSNMLVRRTQFIAIQHFSPPPLYPVIWKEKH